MAGAERLQKLLAAAGLASRRTAEAWIRAGRVTVNGRAAALGDRADPTRDVVRVDGRRIAAEPAAYWLLHKPRGVLSTTRDPHAAPQGRRTVLDLVPKAARRARLYPVGRLDVDSEGLLLLTNDGAVAQALLHPSRGTERVYRVTVRGRVEAAARERLAAGVALDDGPSAPWRIGSLRYDPRRGVTTLEVGLREGRKRQIRRACAAVGHPVQRLVRVRMGPLRLGRLAPGAARPLRSEERRALRRHARGPHPPAESGASAPARRRIRRKPSKTRRGTRGNA